MIAIERLDQTSDDLRSAARSCRNVSQARRILAIAMVLDGHSRTAAATAAGMNRQTLRDWVHRFNAAGVSGLLDHPRSGRPARMSEEQLKDLDGIVDRQPDVTTQGVVRWRCIDLQRIVADRFGIALSERSIGRILRRRGFRHVSARPKHPKSDPAAQDFFKRRSASV